MRFAKRSRPTSPSASPCAVRTCTAGTSRPACARTRSAWSAPGGCPRWAPGWSASVLDAQRRADEGHERPRLSRARLAQVEEARARRVALRDRRGDGEALALDVLDQWVLLVVAGGRALERLAVGQGPLRPD